MQYPGQDRGAVRDIGRIRNRQIRKDASQDRSESQSAQTVRDLQSQKGRYGAVARRFGCAYGIVKIDNESIKTRYCIIKLGEI